MPARRAGRIAALVGLTPLAALAAPPGEPGVAVPLPEASETCADPRFPTLAGPWVVACGPRGKVDRVVSLETGRRYDLPDRLESPGVGPGVLYEPGRDGGLLRLDADGPHWDRNAARVHLRLVAPPATDGAHLAVLDADHVAAAPVEQRGLTLLSAHPAGWQAPALAWPWVAWVEDAGEGDEDVMLLDTRDGAIRVLDGGPGRQRLVVGFAPWLAWVDAAGEVVVWNTATGERAVHPARTGFQAPPALWRDVACWEERPAPGAPADQGIDIACSDGVAVRRPGHQTRPARWDRWLLFRERGDAWLYVVPPGESAGAPEGGEP